MTTVLLMAAHWLLFFIVYFPASAGKTYPLLVGSLIAIPLFTFTATHESRQEKWFVSPVSVWCLFGIFYASLLPLYIYAMIVKNYGDLLQMGQINLEYLIPLVYSFSLLASASFYTGAKLVETGPLKRLVRSLNNLNPIYETRPRDWILLIGISWTIWGLSKTDLPLTKLGMIVQTFTEACMVAPLVIMISRNIWIRGELRVRPAGNRIYLAIISIVFYVLVIAFGSGMRNTFINMFAIFLLGYVLQREMALRDKSLWVSARAMAKPALLILAVFFFTATIIIPYGKQIASSKTGSFQVDERDYKIWEIGASFPNRGIWTMPSRMAAPLMGAAFCAHVEGYIPIDKQTHVGVAVGIIPRILWPEKPYVSKGAYFSIVVGLGGGSQEKEATTATAMSAYGELYWSYGTLGILFGMLILGFMYSFTFRVFTHDFPASPIRTLIACSLLLPCMSWFEADAVGHYVKIIFIWVVFSPFVVFNLPARLGLLDPRTRRRVLAADASNYLPGKT